MLVGLLGIGDLGDLIGPIGDLSDKAGLADWAGPVARLRVSLGLALRASILAVVGLQLESRLFWWCTTCCLKLPRRMMWQVNVDQRGWKWWLWLYMSNDELSLWLVGASKTSCVYGSIGPAKRIRANKRKLEKQDVKQSMSEDREDGGTARFQRLYTHEGIRSTHQSEWEFMGQKGGGMERRELAKYDWLW